MSDLDARAVYVPVPVTPLEYMICLHELGHVASSVARRRDDVYDIERLGPDEIVIEGAAWAWAADMALPVIAAKLTGKDLAAIGGLFTTYIRHWAQREQ
jgi:hypothetical protein